MVIPQPTRIKGSEATWSPNSQYVAYIEPKHSGRASEAGSLVVAKIDGTERQLLVGVEGKPESGAYLFSVPMWSPRGDYIAVHRTRAGLQDIEQVEAESDIVLISVPETLRAAATKQP